MGLGRGSGRDVHPAPFTASRCPIDRAPHRARSRIVEQPGHKTSGPFIGCSAPHPQHVVRDPATKGDALVAPQQGLPRSNGANAFCSGAMSARSDALTERTRGLADLAQPRHAPARRSPRDRFRCDDPVADGSAEPIAAIAPPAQGVAAAHHRTRQISDPRRRAQRGRPRSLAGAHRPAAKRRAAHNDMTTRETPARTTEKANEMVPRRRGAGGRAGMAGLAAAVEFARSNTAQADARSFRAPDRPVAVPDGDGRAGKDRAPRNDFCEKKKEVHAAQSSFSLRRSGTGLNGINL